MQDQATRYLILIRLMSSSMRRLSETSSSHGAWIRRDAQTACSAACQHVLLSLVLERPAFSLKKALGVTSDPLAVLFACDALSHSTKTRFLSYHNRGCRWELGKDLVRAHIPLLHLCMKRVMPNGITLDVPATFLTRAHGAGMLLAYLQVYGRV